MVATQLLHKEEGDLNDDLKQKMINMCITV